MFGPDFLCRSQRTHTTLGAILWQRLERTGHLLDRLRESAGPLAERTVSDARGLAPGLRRLRPGHQGGTGSSAAGTPLTNFSRALPRSDGAVTIVLVLKATLRN